MNAQHQSKSSEWFTPHSWIKKVADSLDGIDLDPAGHPDSPAMAFTVRQYTQQDGNTTLANLWRARSVFLNPPGCCGDVGEDDTYPICGKRRCTCKLPKKFWTHLLDSFRHQRIESAIYLAFSLEQLRWMRIPAYSLIAVPHKRIRFEGPGGGRSPTHGNAFVLLNKHVPVRRRFFQQFSPECSILEAK